MQNILKTSFIMLIFTALSLFFVNKTKAQNHVVISDNSRFVAYAFYDGKYKDSVIVSRFGRQKKIRRNVHGVEINVFQIKGNRWVQSFTFQNRKKRDSKIDELKISTDGQLVYVRQGNEYTICSTPNGEVVFSGEARGVALSHHSGEFFVCLKKNIYRYDQYHSLPISLYPVSGNVVVDEMRINKNDEFIVLKSSNKKIYLWHTSNKRQIKMINGDNVVFNNKKKQVTVLQTRSGRVTGEIYGYYNSGSKRYKLFRKGKFNSGKIIRKIVKEQKKYLKANSPKGSRIKVPEITVNDANAKISPDGKLIAFECVQKSEPFLLVVDVASGTETNRVFRPEGNALLPIFSYNWLDNNLLGVKLTLMASGVFNLKKSNYPAYFNYKLGFHPAMRESRQSVQLKKRQISSNMKFAAMTSYSKTDNPTTNIRLSTVNQPHSTIEGVEFMAFSPNNQMAFVRTPKNRLGFIRLIDVVADRGNYDNVKVTYMSDSVSFIIKEKITLDSKNDDSNYMMMKEIKHISTVPKDELVNLYLKTIEIHDTTSVVQLHLVDKNGTYYYGATEPEWDFIWKRLLLQSPDGKIVEVEDFKVREYILADSLPNAIAFVMDHSGSMGSDRTKALQRAAKEFVKGKKSNDAVSLIKFDGNVGVEVPLSPTQSRLVRKIKVNGLRGYGGSTALLDGMDRGTGILKNKPKYGRKVVVSLTDGYENSSMKTKGQILKNATREDINFVTIGFGDYVNEEYLQTLASYTAGSFYQIYENQSFEWIFHDVYKKMNYYYTIEFTTKKQGEFTTMIQIELDENRKDSLVTTFDNTPPDFDRMDEEEDFGNVYIPPVTRKTKSNPTKFTSYIDSLKTIKTVIIEVPDSVKTEFEGIEFPDIKFTFDETKVVKGTADELEDVAVFMKKYPEIKIEISGHTDNRGAFDHNLDLSQRRADKIKSLLTDLGVSKNRIRTRGYGDTRPITNNKTEEGRSKNRRVEFIIIE